MTRKDYVAIAAALAKEKPGTNWDRNKMVQWELDTVAIADVFARDNPRFDRQRFLSACNFDL